MSTGSRDLASDFINILSEDEIFSMPLVDASGVDEFGFGDSAGDSPLHADLQWKDHEGLEAALEAFLNEANPAHGTSGVLAKATGEVASQLAYVQRSVEMWPNAGGLVRQQLAALWRGASERPHMSSFRRSFSHSPHVKRRWAPGRSILDPAPLPTPGALLRRRRSVADIPEVGRNLEYRPVAQTPNVIIIVEGFPSMLRHPFDASIIPVMYSVNRAHEPQAPPIRAHCQAFSAPATDSTAVTVHPVEDQMESQHMNLDEQTTMMGSTYGDHESEQAERVPLVGDVNHGTTLCSDMECLQPAINPPAAGHISQRAAPQPKLNDIEAKISRTPRLSWTPELISKFEAAIVLLGGPVKATPKAIAQCMACPQVTIFHVKSRLQKFRMQAGMQVDPSRRRTKRNRASRVTHEQSPEDTFETKVIWNQVYETCKDWTDELEAENLHMLHMLAAHNTQSEAAIQHNARVLEEYSAWSAASTIPQP